MRTKLLFLIAILVIKLTVMQAQTITYTMNGITTTSQPIGEVEIGSLVDATYITTNGEWNNDQVNALKSTFLLQSSMATIKLLTADFSNMTFIGDIDMSRIFSGCSLLTTVKMPSGKIENPINFEYAFASCSQLGTIDLKEFNHITSLNNAFSYCSILSDVTLNGDLSSILDWTNAFMNSYPTIHVPEKANLGTMPNEYKKLVEGYNVNNKVEYTTASGSGMLSSNNLMPESLTDAISIILKGTWDADDISRLRQALVSKDNINYKLVSAVFDTNAVVSKMENLFTDCQALETVILPMVTNNSAVSFRNAFSNCPKLTVVDLSEFVNLSNLSNTFKNCPELVSVKLPSNNTVQGVDFSNAFSNCPKLTSIDLSGFDRILSLNSTFSNCTVLSSVSLNGNLSSVKEWTDAFLNTHPVIHVPENAKLGSMPNEYRKLIQNYSVNNKVEYTTAGGSGTLSSNELTAACLSDAISITVKGVWETEDISMLHQALVNEDNSNTTLISVIFETDAVINSMANIFAGCRALETVMLPKVINSSIVNFSYAFADCLKLKAIDLSGFDNVISFNGTFSNCSVLSDVTLNGNLSSVMSWTNTFLNSHPTIYVPENADLGSMPNKYKLLIQGYEIASLVEYTTVIGSDVFTPDELTPGALEYAVSITVKGSWNADDISKLHQALVVGTNPNTMLTSAVFEADAVVNSMENLFLNCQALETISLPTVMNNSAVSFRGTFQECHALSSTIDLRKFGNINSFSNTFRKCKELTSIIFPAGTMAERIDFTYTFEGCSKLINIDLRKFDNITNLGSAFTDCTALSTVTFNANLSSVRNWRYTFRNSNPIIRVPEDANLGSMPDEYKEMIEYYNSNNKVEYTSVAGEGWYTSDELTQGILAGAVSITIKGSWENDDILKLHWALMDMNNLNLVLNSVEFDTDAVINSMENLFKGCRALKSVVLPTVTNSSSVNFEGAFQECFALSSTIDLGSFSAISSLKNTFYGCNELTSVKLPAGTTEANIDLSGIFSYCSKLMAIDLSHFSNASGFKDAFTYCQELTSVKLPAGSTWWRISFESAFEGCSKITAIDLSNFNNIISFRNTFSNCPTLKNITLGNDLSLVTDWTNFLEDNNPVIHITEGTNLGSMPEEYRKLIQGYNVNDKVEYTVATGSGMFTPDGLTAGALAKALSITIKGTWEEEDISKLHQALMGNSGVNTSLTSVVFKADATINSMENIFAGCQSLETVVLPIIAPGSTLSFKSAFAGCRKLSVIDLSIYDNVSSFNETFRDCSALSKVILSKDLSSVTDWMDAFKNSYPSIYVPEEVNLGSMPDEYRAFIQSYNVKNRVEYVTAIGGGRFTTDELTTGSLTDAISIIIKGMWTTDDIYKLHQALMGEESFNEVLISAEFEADAIVNSMENLFNGCTALATMVLPKVVNNSPVSFEGTFYRCYALSSPIDLSCFNNVSSFKNTFYICSKLPTVILPPSTTAESISFESTFGGCSKLIDINLSSFNNISSFSNTFSGCSELTSIKLPTGTTAKSIDFSGTFGSCRKLATIDLSAFNNISSFSSTFSGCSELTSIKLPAGTTAESIDFDATFHDCSKLTIVDLSTFDNVSFFVKTFVGCSELTSIKLPAGTTAECTDLAFTFGYCEKLTALDLSVFSHVNNFNMAFSGCSELTAVKFPSDTMVEKIDLTEAFSYCSKLATIDLSCFGSISNLNETFAGCSELVSVTFPSGTTAENINFSVTFGNCSKLATVDLSAFNNISSFSGTFSGCSELTSIKLPSGTTAKNIDFENTFSGCSKLAAIDLSRFDNISSFSHAFNNCSELVTIKLPSGTTAKSLDFTSTFSGCSKLTTIDLSNFSNVRRFNAIFSNCSELTSVKLPSTTAAGYIDFGFGFYMCSKLTTVDLSNFGNVSSFLGTFGGCRELTSVTFPSETVIDTIFFKQIFYDCPKLTTVNLSGYDNMTSLEGAFSSCTSLSEVTLNEDLTSIKKWDNAFDNHNEDLTIKVPVNAKLGTMPKEYRALVRYYDPNAINNNKADSSGIILTGGQGKITLISEKAQTFQIIATNGNMLRSIHLNAGETRIIDDLPAGIYVVNGQKTIVY